MSKKEYYCSKRNMTFEGLDQKNNKDIKINKSFTIIAALMVTVFAIAVNVESSHNKIIPKNGLSFNSSHYNHVKLI
jgi:hypothetical protein